MSNLRSSVNHHPLVHQDQDDFGVLSSSNPVSGSPETGYIMDTDLTGLAGSFNEPPDHSLSLLEVPNTNWTPRPGSSASTGSEGSTAPITGGSSVSIEADRY